MQLSESVGARRAISCSQSTSVLLLLRSNSNHLVPSPAGSQTDSIVVVTTQAKGFGGQDNWQVLVNLAVVTICHGLNQLSQLNEQLD